MRVRLITPRLCLTLGTTKAVESCSSCEGGERTPGPRPTREPPVGPSGAGPDVEPVIQEERAREGKGKVQGLNQSSGTEGGPRLMDTISTDEQREGFKNAPTNKFCTIYYIYVINAPYCVTLHAET